MGEQVSYSEIHAYMLQKTREYYQNPPEILIQAVIARQKVLGVEISRAEAKKLVSTIDIQRYLKQEMKQKWPQFMSAIPENSLKD